VTIRSGHAFSIGALLSLDVRMPLKSRQKHCVALFREIETPSSEL
jgi:hypothetical protein